MDLPDRFLRALLRLRERAPLDVRVTRELVELYISEERHAEAAEALRRFLRHASGDHPENRWAQQQLAKVKVIRAVTMKRVRDEWREEERYQDFVADMQRRALDF